jgi:putative membrane protein
LRRIISFNSQTLKEKEMNMYEGYHFGGMHLLWWCIWVLLFVWIFATPYAIPGQKSRRESPADILKRRFAAGEINVDEYNERRNILEKV